jgi:DNA primase
MIKVSDILDNIGIPYKETGNSYKVKCWFHDETKPSMSIHREIGMYHCFSCHESGNIFKLIDHHLNLTGIEALKYLSKLSSGGNSEEDRFETAKQCLLKRTLIKKEETQVIEIPYNMKLESHPYLRNRGFSPKETQEWEMGQVIVSPYKGWIVIPIYQNGILRNYFLRNPFGSNKLYGRYSRKDILFGIESADDSEQPIYLVEGIFDMIALRRVGVQAVATLSNRLHESKGNEVLQLEKLKIYKKVVIVPDNDSSPNKPGYQLVKDALPLTNSSEVCVCSLPHNKKDTAECTLDELKQTITNEMNIIDFIIKERNKCNGH